MQAARGTSVAPSRPRLIAVLAAVAAFWYALDQVTKQLAVDRLDGRPDVQVVGEVLQLHLVRNPGAAFSTGTGFTPVFTAISVLAVLAVLWYARRLGSTTWAVALGFLLAGVAGNLTDRIVREPEPFHGHVIDFLMLPNWPVFNVADICINVAAGLIVLLAFRGVHLDGTRESDRDDDPADDVTDSADDPTDAGDEPASPAPTTSTQEGRE